MSLCGVAALLQKFSLKPVGNREPLKPFFVRESCDKSGA